MKSCEIEGTEEGGGLLFKVKALEKDSVLWNCYCEIRAHSHALDCSREVIWGK